MTGQREARPAQGHQADHEPDGDQTSDSPQAYDGADALRSEEVQARRLTDRIKDLLDSIAGQVDGLVPLVKEAQASGAHEALGYRSWTAYVAAEFADHPLRLDREDRRGLVSMLAVEGMSTRAIATVVGVNQATVSRDLGTLDAVASPSPVTGLDGKAYTPADRSSPEDPNAWSPAFRGFIDDLRRVERDLEGLAVRAQSLGPDSAETDESREQLRHGTEALMAYASMFFDAALDGLDGRPLRTRVLVCAMKGEDRDARVVAKAPPSPHGGVTTWSRTGGGHR